jgi:hypothetical protein
MVDVGSILDRSSVNFGDCEDTENWDKVRDRLCDGRKLGLFSESSSPE